MKTRLAALTRSFVLLACLFTAAHLRADDSAELAAVQAADDERVAAILAADAARLDAIFSADLSYTHSNGHHDTKQSYLETLLTHKTVYRRYEYQERSFSLPAPDIALLRARVFINSTNGTATINNDLSVLAVFRKESGKWRFLAWQSAKLPPPPAAPAAK